MHGGEQHEVAQARRRFLASCGKFAALTPPTVTLLLSAAQAKYAVAASGNVARSSVSSARGPRGNNGFGNGGFDGSPNGKEDIDR